jgi:hypothetical protein
MNAVQQLEREAALGLQVEHFLAGEIGKYLVGRAEAEVDAAVQALKTVKPTDAERIQELQNEIFRAESVQYWLAEAIQAGLNAQQELLGD